MILAPVYHQHVRLVNRLPGSRRVLHDHRSVARRLHAYICSKGWKNHIHAKARASLSIQRPMNWSVHNILLRVITQVSKGWSGSKGPADCVLSIECAIAFMQLGYCYCRLERKSRLAASLFVQRSEGPSQQYAMGKMLHLNS
jgi:hypothetical protein